MSWGASRRCSPWHGAHEQQRHGRGADANNNAVSYNWRHPGHVFPRWPNSHGCAEPGDQYHWATPPPSLLEPGPHAQQVSGIIYLGNPH